MFKVGDIVTGTEYNSHSCTSAKALMIVTETVSEYSSDDAMYVTILYHENMNREVGEKYKVDNSETYFRYITFQEWNETRSRCYRMGMSDIQSYLRRYPNENRGEYVKFVEVNENAKPVPNVLSDEMRKELITEMKELLFKYHYHPTDEALNDILDEWCRNKADLIRLFEKHPNCNGRFQIAFDYDYDRKFDREEVLEFERWLKSSEVKDAFLKEVKIGAFTYEELYRICNNLMTYLDIFNEHPGMITTVNGNGRSYYVNEYNRFSKIKKNMYEDNPDICVSCLTAYDKKSYDAYRSIDKIRNVLRSDGLSQFINGCVASYLNDYFPEAKIKERQKTSRAINKILSMLGVNEFPNYNKEFAKFSDAINPLKIKRHTVISIHPVDYLTMSFGNSWASCHTIDKKNDRGIDSEHNYRGCNSSGTMSYMLDGTSCVFYTVDASHDGNNIELADKINRCMFHYYDNQLVQGRVYPQSNDSGANDLYRDIREIAQKVFADCLGVPNFWTNKKGSDECCDAIHSTGTHYRDYANYDTCNISTLKDGMERHKLINVGHYPICPCCGVEHRYEDNIECCDCRED